MGEFIKGYKLPDGTNVFEGEDVKFTTIQSVTVEATIVKAANKKVEVQLDGEVETRTYLLESIVKCEKI